MCIHERRKFRRVQAPIFCRATGPLSSLRYKTRNISRGGIRVLSDEKYEVGQRMDLELLLPDQTFLSLPAKVVWLSTYEGENHEEQTHEEDTHKGPKWEMGLCFVDISPKEMELLEPILEDEEADKRK
ncbi:MAG: PilZ domain-containing protein [Cystobacterineae bacterium]|nr:PilZ domain-containing protein [Cystobacterineae bacterium]